jgi:phosphate:Na+ symporter
MPELSLGPLLMGLFGGLAIFLFGMEQMTDALKSVAGAGMSKVLGTLTKNRFTAAITGAFVTAVIQSSSVTTVLVVGFISAGLMSVQQSIGVIMGANIGTTVTAQIIAFKITKYALALVAIGFAATFFSKRRTWTRYGAMVMGLGMIFLGMAIMSEATTPLRDYDPFIELMGRMSSPLLGILVAAVFTALVQSSSATTGIVIVLASQGFITLDAGIALAFGANIGTCVTAALAALGKPREATQAAVAHLLFNLLGVAIWLPFIAPLADAVVAISPARADLEGTARLAAETPRQIANAHTIFNVANTVIFIWFTGPMARLVIRLLPPRPAVVPRVARPKFIQDVYLETPALALDRARLEIARLGRHAIELSADAGPVVRSGTDEQLDGIVDRAHDNQLLYDAITRYVRKLSSGPLSPAETRRLSALTAIAAHVQHIAETIAVNQVAVGRERLDRNVTFGEETVERVRALGTRVREAIDLAIKALEDPTLAPRVVEMKSDIQTLVAEVVEHLAQRLVSDDPHRSVLYRLETQAVEILQREYYFAKRIAKEIILEQEASADDPLPGADGAATGPDERSS